MLSAARPLCGREVSLRKTGIKMFEFTRITMEI